MRTDLHLSPPFTLVSCFHCKIIQYGSNAKLMMILRLLFYWPYVRILGLPTADHQCGNFAVVKTWCMDSLILAQMYPLKSIPLPIHPVVKVKIECDIDIVIHHFDSSESGKPPLSTRVFKPSLPPSILPFWTPLLYALKLYVLFIHPLPNCAFPFFNVCVL